MAQLGTVAAGNAMFLGLPWLPLGRGAAGAGGQPGGSGGKGFPRFDATSPGGKIGSGVMKTALLGGSNNANI